MYYHAKTNYKHEKQPDGSVTVTRTPVFDDCGVGDGVLLMLALPALIFSLGMACVIFSALMFQFELAGWLFTMSLKASVGGFIVGGLLVPVFCWLGYEPKK